MTGGICDYRWRFANNNPLRVAGPGEFLETSLFLAQLPHRVVEFRPASRLCAPFPLWFRGMPFQKRKIVTNQHV